jgi:hypothetical protein
VIRENKGTGLLKRKYHENKSFSEKEKGEGFGP